MKKFYIVVLILLFLAKSAYAQEVLSVDNARSYVLDLDDGGKKYSLAKFLESERLSFLEGHKLEAHIIINKVATSNPPDTYVFEMRTDLWNAEWQYKIFGETKVFKSVKITVWNNPQEHSAYSFDVVISGEVPKPAIKIVEPHFESYSGEGPGFRNTNLAIFTIYNGEINPTNKVQEVGEYAFLSTNLNIKTYLEKIEKNLDISGLPKDYVIALENHKEYIKKLSEDGHVGLAFDLSQSFATVVGKINNLPSNKDSRNTLIIAILVIIILTSVAGVIGYRAGHKRVPQYILDRFDRSLETLDRNNQELISIDAVNEQRTKFSNIKSEIDLSIAENKDARGELEKYK